VIDRRLLAVLAPTIALTITFAACADDAPAAQSQAVATTVASPPATVATTPATTPATTATSAPSTTATPPTSTTPAPTAPPVPTTTEPKIEIPLGVLVAVPTQNREDPAKNQFQIQIHNGTHDRYDIDGVQFDWAGYTTPMTPRDSVFVGGQVIDYPVPFPGASCVGDGTRATMPSLDDAKVVLLLDSGETVDVPVVDKWHLARKLYENDCEKQMIDTQVTIEWVDLHEGEFEGRPVTVGELRLTRKAGEGEYTILEVSNTVPFAFDAIDSDPGQPVVTLAADADQVSVPVQFIESRCDPHALAEIKQPTKFVAQVLLGDGSEHPYIIYPERSYWTPMRLTADKACFQLGKVEFLGENP
jgi:hypothetical protein